MISQRYNFQIHSIKVHHAWSLIPWHFIQYEIYLLVTPVRVATGDANSLQKNDILHPQTLCRCAHHPYTPMHTHTHIHTYTYTYTYTHIYIHTHIQTHRHTQTHIHIYLHKSIHIHTHAHAHAHAHTHTHIHIHTNTHLHIHTVVWND